MSFSQTGVPYVATDPQRLASGVTTDAVFVPFQLWAGECDIVTSQGVIGASLPQYSILARDTINGNQLVAWNPAAGDGAPVAFASGTYTFSAAPTANDTVTINGNVITFVAANPANIGTIPSAPEGGEVPQFTAGQCPIGVVTPAQLDNNGNVITPALTAAQASALNLYNYVNTFQGTLLVNALVDATGLIVTIEANSAGTAGNAITIAKSSSAIAVSGATLSGGTVDANRQLSTGKAIAVLAQPSISGQFAPYYVGGFFNHEALVWPPGVDTIAARKAAFDGTGIRIGVLIG